MKIKKIVSAVAAAAAAVAMMAVNVFATTVEVDSEYPGSWTSTGNGIRKEELLAVGGDVKITLNVEVYNPLGLADQFVINPMDYDNGWASVTSSLTGKNIVAKGDGWICVPQDATTLEIVLPAETIEAMGDTGLCFNAANVYVKSAEYGLADGKLDELVIVSDADGKAYCFGNYDPFASAEAAETTETAETDTTDADAIDVAATDDAATTDAPATGNTAVAVIVTVMAAAGAAAVVSKKRN